jgi:hypothetical protein
MSQLIKNICETGEWPKVFTEVPMIPLKKPSSTKGNDHRIIDINTLSERIVAWILRRRLKGKLRMYLKKMSFDIEEEKELEKRLGCSK